MRALGLLILVPVVMWLSQSALLVAARRPLRARIGAPDLPAGFKQINRVVTYAAFIGVLVLYPVLRGAAPHTFYARFLPLGPRPLEMVHGAGAAVLYLSLLYLAWLLSGNVRFEVRHRPGRLARRLLAAPLTALLVAFFEELLFRAMLLAELLETLPAWAAVAIGAVVFAGAHYVRSVKRHWTIAGHLALGVLFCVPFVLTGALWVSAGLHFGGVLVLMAARPFVRYTGPPWLVGASVFPFAGVVGVAALVLLTLNMWLSFGSMP